MDTQGIGTMLKLLLAIAIIGVIAIVARLTGFIKNPSNQQAQGTPTPTITVTPSAITSASDIDALSAELDNQGKEMDSLDKDLADLDTSFSTTDTDQSMKNLDAIK